MRASRLSFLPLLLISAFSFAAKPVVAPSNAPQIPLVFENNAGQTAPQVRYLARSREGSIFFTPNEVVVSAPRAGALRLTFAGSLAQPELLPEDVLPSRSNYLDRDPSASITGVSNYSSLRYRNLYPGVDLRFYGNAQHLEHDVVVAPGADPSQFVLQLEGVASTHLAADGSVQFQLGEATLQESAPIAWQLRQGRRVPVRANWNLEAHNRLRIRVGTYDNSLPLTIDPVLAYSTFLGGSTASDESLGTTYPASTQIYSVAVDTNGNIYVAGTTSATDFPTTSGAYDRSVNYQSSFHADTLSQTGFVTKFDKTGMLVYSTFLHWEIYRIAVDKLGEVYAAKDANDSYNGPSSGFDDGIEVDKLSADGSKLLYDYSYGQTPTGAPPACTNVPGDSGIGGISADNSGHVWIAGTTSNPCLIVSSNAYQKTYPAPNSDSGFVAELDTTKTGDASVIAATYLGGTQGSGVSAVAVDSSGNSYVTGFANSSDFPHTNVFGTDTSGTAFVTKLNATLSALVFSDLINGVSYLTQTGGASTAIALDPSNNVYFAGYTSGAGYPTTSGAYRTKLSGVDGFVSELNSAGSAFIYSTFLGGSSTDKIYGLTVNNGDIAFVTGSTQSTDFPTTSSAFQKTLASGATNAFVTAINAGGKSLYYSTFLGGSTSTVGTTIFMDPAWNAYVAGYTSDSNFPVTSTAYQPKLKGATDGFLSKVVISGDLKATMTDNVSTIAHNGYVTFYARVYNAGPDTSNNVAFSDPIPSGWAYAGLYTNTMDSCTAPTAGSTSGTVVCKKSALTSGQTVYVNVYLQAIAASGSTIKNTISTSAQTQDLNPANNTASLSVKVN